MPAGFGRFLLRTHPTDERSLTSCLCIKELIDGSNGLSWHPYAFVWRFSEGVRGNLRAGPTGIRCDALAIRRLGLLRTKTKKLRGEHEGIRIGPLTGRVGRGRASMADTRRAKARRRFSESSVPICDTRGRSGPKVSTRREPGGNRQSEGTKAKPRKPNVFNGFRGFQSGRRIRDSNS